MTSAQWSQLRARADELAREHGRGAGDVRVRFPWSPGALVLLFVPLAWIAYQSSQWLPRVPGLSGDAVQALFLVPAAFAICGFWAALLLRRRAPRNPDGSVRYEFEAERVPVVLVRKELRRIPWPPWTQRTVVVEDASGERTVHHADEDGFARLAPPQAGVATLAHHRLLDFHPIDATEPA